MFQFNYYLKKTQTLIRFILNRKLNLIDFLIVNI
jgi:hypothetical protein